MNILDFSTSNAQITDELLEVSDSNPVNLLHDVFYNKTGKEVEIYTASGGGGTQLVEGTDYDIGGTFPDGSLPSSISPDVAYTTVAITNATYHDTTLYVSYYPITDLISADRWNGFNDKLLASIPAHYSRSGSFLAKSNTARTTITTPNKILVNIDDTGEIISGSEDIDLDTTDKWDNTTYQTASNRAGNDFYIYAIAIGNITDLVLSDDDSAPSGYTTSNSRKIGGFHCLCAAVGTNTYGYINSVDDIALVDEAYVSHTISGTQHWLEGYIAGDVLPFSIWDLIHRPSSNPEGMVYDPGSDKWVDIYLASWDGSHLVTADGGSIADGGGTPAFHQYKFSQLLGRQKKLLPRQDEFVSFSLGSPQGVNISGSADPGTTGGHSATDGKRIVSLIGVEDATGVLWQWGREAGATNDVGGAWADAYDTNDDNVGGQHYEAPNRPRFGGGWGYGASCGSRGSSWNVPALYLRSSIGGRGVAEPLGRRS